MGLPPRSGFVQQFIQAEAASRLGLTPALHGEKMPDIDELVAQIRKRYLAIFSEHAKASENSDMPRSARSGTPTISQSRQHGLLSIALAHSPDGGE
jgi:hypothetical protein